MAVKEDNYLLGSGDLFIGTVPNVATATEEEITASLVNVGAISGGATLTYTPTFYEIESANRGTIASFKTKEEVVFKSGILTWNLKNLEKLSAAYYSEDLATGVRRLGIGGAKNVPINYVRFVHTKPDGNTLTMNLFKAQAQSGFELTFDKEQETVIDAEFKAMAVIGKDDGNLVEIIDQGAVPEMPTPTIESISPSTLSVDDQPTTVTVNGTGFVPQSVALIDVYIGEDTPLNTTYVSETELKVEVNGLSASNNTIKVKNGNLESKEIVTLKLT